MTRRRTLSVDWVSDLGDLERDMAKAQRAIKQGQRDLDRLTGGQQKSERQGNALGRSLRGLRSNYLLVTGAVVAGTAALAGAVLTAKSFVNAASDLEEAQSKVGVVFQESVDEVRRWADASDVAFGISERAALNYTGTLGNLLVAQGQTSEAAADMSIALLARAADIASFNNTSIEESLTALRSALVGEFEPLRKYGGALNAAMVEAKALELGLADTKAEITEADKVTARYTLALEQTSTVAGDFARTSGGLANQQRILNAQLDNVKTTIGEGLLPVFTDMVTATNEWLATNGDEFAENLASGIESAAGFAADLLKTLVDITELGVITVKFVDESLPPGTRQALTDQLTGRAQREAFSALVSKATSFFRDPPTPILTPASLESLVPALAPIVARSILPGLAEGLEFDDARVIFARRQAGRVGDPAQGGAAGSGTAFGAGNLGLIDSLLGGLPLFSGDDLAEFEAAREAFTATRREVTRSLAELGLSMADLDARGLENSATFKEQQERAAAFRDALGRIDLIEDLRLNPFVDAMREAAQAVEQQIEAEREMARIRRTLTEQTVQLVASAAGGRLSAGAVGGFIQQTGLNADFVTTLLNAAGGGGTNAELTAILRALTDAVNQEGGTVEVKLSADLQLEGVA